MGQLWTRASRTLSPVEVLPGLCHPAAQPPPSPGPWPCPWQTDGQPVGATELLDLNSSITGSLFCIWGKQISLSSPHFPPKAACRRSPWEGWDAADHPPGWEEASLGRRRKRRG